MSSVSSSGVEQQRREGRVHGPGGAVRLGEGHLRAAAAAAEEARPAVGRRDARQHQPEDRHLHSADRHVTSDLGEASITSEDYAANVFVRDCDSFFILF